MSVNNAAATSVSVPNAGTTLIEDTLCRLKNCLTLVEPNIANNEETNSSSPTENENFTVTEVTITAEITSTSKQASAAQTTTPDQVIALNTETKSTTEVPSKSSDSINENRVVIESFRDESQMPDIMRMITNDLSEPYSIYTYRYFIHNWPDLCLLARDTVREEYVGVIVCKLDEDQFGVRRGYIAMLAVDESARRMGLGTRLVTTAINRMRVCGCDEVVLETEVTNLKALSLYSKLGFIREKRLFRYYLNGVDAFRLKLFFQDPNELLEEQKQLEELLNSTSIASSSSGHTHFHNQHVHSSQCCHR
uniref:N-terminal methionine N(alpha)-acetyltransferase NatC n=1 Tax=Acrobeloides nanus TaxID=290746 RepID=A0A914E0D3_9BILA